MGKKLRKLRLRLSASWSIVRSKLMSAAWSSPTPRWRDVTVTEEQGHVATLTELQWNEARRVHSEPVRLLCRPASEESLACSFSSQGTADDDVFLDSDDGDERLVLQWEKEDVRSQGECLDTICTNFDALEDWLILANEISVGVVLSSSENVTIYRGYWHGSVHIHVRKPTEVNDIGNFLDEVSILSCIRHENIQLFMGVCLNMGGGSLGIVTSDLKGESLHARLHKYNHNFTTPSKLKILKQIAEGMEYLHAKGIPHGSLSTKNIHIHCRVCISISPQVGDSKTIGASELVYLPPECVRQLYITRGRMVLEGRPMLAADMFALGTLVYELVTLEKPLKSLPLESVVWCVGRGECQPLSLLRKGKFRTIISRCWAENPASRPVFNEILASLEQNLLHLLSNCDHHVHCPPSYPSLTGHKHANTYS